MSTGSADLVPSPGFFPINPSRPIPAVNPTVPHHRGYTAVILWAVFAFISHVCWLSLLLVSVRLRIDRETPNSTVKAE